MVRFEVRDEEGQCLYVCMCVECRSGNERGVRTCVCDCVCVTVYVCECVCVCDMCVEYTSGSERRGEGVRSRKVCM